MMFNRVLNTGIFMSYMLLIVEPIGQRRERGEAQGEAVYQQMVDFAADLKRRGKLRAVESLQSQEGAARVQRRGGGHQVIDGPFAEAKEMVGGFFLLDNVDTRDEALALAAECPAAEWATIEVRALGPCYQ
jgi:hypothetical protein